MGNNTHSGAVPAFRASNHRKRPREVKDEMEAEVKDEVKDEDENSNALPTHRHRRRRRHSRSRTPSPSPSLGGNDNTPEPEDDATSPDNLPASLDRHACQRCLKFLASEPEFECEFPARSTKCTRCTRLKDKCDPVPASADAEGRVLLGLQAKYEVSPPLSRKSLRRRIVTAAEDFAATVRMAAQRRPKTPTEINLALIHGQEEIIALLRDIKAELTAQGKEEKRKGHGRSRG